MSCPGIGTIVTYHSAGGYDLPLTVQITPSSWSETMGDNAPKPETGQVILIGLDITGNPMQITSAEGTAATQFSLLAIQASDS